MNVFGREMRAQILSALVWAGLLCAITGFLFAMYPLFAENVDALTGALENYPLVFRLAFGLVIEKIGTVEGYFAFCASFLALLAGVQGTTLGISLLARERIARTEEFLLTKPVPRVRIAQAKLLAGVVLVALTQVPLAATASACAVFHAGGALDRGLFAALVLSVIAAQDLCFALGYLVSALAPRIRSVTPVALTLTLALFALGAIVAMLDLRQLFYLSPFKYIDPARVLAQGGLSPAALAAAAIALFAMIFAGHAAFIARDVRAQTGG